MTATTDKTRETRLRRMADRQGLKLVKSRRRDPRAIDYQGYMLTSLDPSAYGAVVAGCHPIGRPHWTLDDVESYLAPLPGYVVDAHNPPPEGQR